MKLDPARNPWGQNEALRVMADVLVKDGVCVRIVGGAVRDSLLGRAVTDVDLAVNVPPERVMGILESAGIKVVPTGLTFGTVTAVWEGRGYEITSLRQDVTTDGRRAVVAYTDNWEEDAGRRDFTINALSVDFEGEVYDYVGGLEDLKAARLRFIGNPEERIREDVLRILRYYRFLAQLGPSFAPDDGARAACRAMAALLPDLSAERLGQETARILMGQAAEPVARLMEEDGIWAAFLAQTVDTARLGRVSALEERLSIVPLLARRLVALLGDSSERAVQVLRLSKEQTRHLVACRRTVPFLLAGMKSTMFRQLIYDTGTDVARSALVLAAAEGGEDNLTLLPVLEAWENPVFPLTGADLAALGYTQGPVMGAALRAVEQWWRDHDFKPTKEACLAEAGSGRMGLGT